MSLLTAEQLDSMRALTATAYRHLADVWRLDKTTQRRELLTADVLCSISPAKHPDRLATDEGGSGTRHSYTATCAVTTDLIYDDQLRNIRSADDGSVWLDAKLTVYLTAKWPATLTSRLYEEA